METNAVEFTCTVVKTVPEPIITWIFKNKTLKDETLTTGLRKSVFRLSDVIRELLMVLTDVIENEFKSLRSSSGHLTVHCLKSSDVTLVYVVQAHHDTYICKYCIL